MGNALGCCADQSDIVTEKKSPTGGITTKKVMFGKKHEETESSEEDQSVEGRTFTLYFNVFFRNSVRAREEDTRSQSRIREEY